MFNPSRARNVAILFSLIAVAGCRTFFLPPYSEEISAQLGAASEGIQKLQVMIGDTDHRQYADVEPVYVDVLTHLGEARTLAERRASGAGGPSARPASIIVANIGRCEDAVKTAMTDTKSSGPIDVQSFKDRLIPDICSKPALEESALNR